MLKPGRYRHYKNKDYEVIGCATHTETGEKLVVYRALYGDEQLWVRPKEMFTGSVEINGHRLPRFRYIGSDIAGTSKT